MPSNKLSSAGHQPGKQPVRPWFVPVAFCAAGLLITLVVWRVTIAQNRTADEARFAELSERVTQTISNRLKFHEQVLTGLKGLFAASKSVERGEFRDYIKTMHLENRPGAMGFGFIRFVPAGNLEKFLQATRADDAPEFTCQTSGTQPDLFVVEYIEPFTQLGALRGLDLGANRLQREAATAAVNQNNLTLSPPIRSVVDDEPHTGFLMLLPVYANGLSTVTKDERWRALLGWVYTPLLMQELAANIAPVSGNQIDFEIFDEDATSHLTLMFDSDGHLTGIPEATVDDPAIRARPLHRQSAITFGGRRWRLQISTLPDFDTKGEHRLPWYVLFGGLVISGLVAAVAHSSRRARQNALKLAETMTVELREEIIQREQTTRTLREISNFQDAIMQSAAYAIISTTPEGVIRLFNPAAQRLLGYTEEEMIGRQTPAIFHDPDEVVARAKEFSAELGFTVEPGFDVFVIKSCKGLPNEHEWTYVRKDGSRVPVTLSVTAVRDDHGGFSGYLGVAVDMTERKRAWAELLQSRHTSDAARHELELQRDALDQHAIVSITDLQGKIQHANDRFCAISGYHRHELIGQPHRIINSGHHPKTFWAGFWQTINAGNVWHGEICNRAKEGQLYWVNATVVPFHDSDGEISRFVAIRTDITARKLAEAELLEARKIADAANQSKSEFLAEMSHEIRTPMNAVLGFTELLAMTPLNEKQRSFVDTIQLSGQNLLTLINDILDYSKIEAGKLEVERLDFDAVNAAETVVKTLSLQAKTKSLALILNCLRGTPRQVSADPTRVRQVLINLVGNALKFTKKGGVTISTELVAADGNPRLRLNVTDTGIGLSPDQQARLFTKFMQAKASTTREFGGTGLGLAICKRLVELMGGEIGVTSTEGQGSTFWFTLPLAANVKPPEILAAPRPTHKIEPIQLAAPSALPARTPMVPATARVWQVLVVDDNQINQQLACAFLSKLNCQASLANNGAEAARIVQQKNFDLILMDYQMPVMDGMQATTAIRHWESAQPGKKRLTIIALTANLTPEVSNNFIACGMDACLAKPLMFPELKSIIANLSPVSAPSEPGSPPAVATAPASPLPALAGKSTAMDRERALQQTDNNPALLGMLAQAFLAQCPGLMESIGLALKARDEEALKQHAHKLKGSISVFAATWAQTIVLALNTFPTPPDWVKLDQLGQELETEIARLRPELAALSSTPSSK